MVYHHKVLYNPAMLNNYNSNLKILIANKLSI